MNVVMEAVLDMFQQKNKGQVVSSHPIMNKACAQLFRADLQLLFFIP